MSGISVLDRLQEWIDDDRKRRRYSIDSPGGVCKVSLYYELDNGEIDEVYFALDLSVEDVLKLALDDAEKRWGKP